MKLHRIAFFLFTCSAFAQDSGSISGAVSNLTKQPVANAPLQATNTKTSAVYKASSSSNGQYKLSPLPPGAYDISVTVPGYNPFVQKNVTVTAGKNLDLDIHLFDYQLDTLGDGKEFRIDLTSEHPAPKGPTPRTADGKPDLSGVWFAQRPVDLGKPEMLPWAEKLVQERAANNSKDAPGARCLTRGILAAGALFPYKLVQTPKLLVMLFEDDIPSHRQVFLDGRQHPKDPNPSWMGHSIGRWEKDTLVIDTVGFNDRFWLDPQGHPHTEKMHVIERIRRADLGHLEIEFTIDDPDTYAKPWILKRMADLDQGDEIGEYVCENNHDPEHMVGK